MPKRNKNAHKFDGPLSASALRQWLIEDLAARLDTDPASIDTGKSFEAYGLDSRTAIQVSGSLEKLVERRLSPGLLYEHETIDDLCDYLSQELPLADQV